MKIEDLYQELKKKDYNLLFNRNNLNIYQSGNCFLIYGNININKNKLLDKLLNPKLDSIINIEEISKNINYVKIKLNSQFIDYPIIDRIEEVTKYEINKQTLIYYKLKDISFEIKDKQCLEFVEYIESGYFLINIEEINQQSRIEIFIVDLDLKSELIIPFVKNFSLIINELKNI